MAQELSTKISDSAYALLRERASANREAFYVYQDVDSGFNHGFPSSYFGVIGKNDIDAACIDDSASAIGCSGNLDRLDRERGTVLRITFDPLVSGKFAGLNIEEPEGFSSRPRGIGYDLTGASHILFEARSPTGLDLQFGLDNRLTDFLQLPQNPDF